MKRLLTASVAAAALWAGSAAAENTALVIGNGDYAHAPDADTAVRDANAVASALKQAGWTVHKGTDLNREQMRALLTTFASDAEASEAIVIYYSGHALRAGGISFLAPVDTQARNLTDVVFDGVPLDLLMSAAADKAGNAVIFVDGAQLRGFKPNSRFEPGLADIEGPDGVLVVSAAEPGQAVRRSSWRDSRFARLVVNSFLSPGESVMSVAANAPSPTWVTGSVDADFALAALPEPEPDGLDAEIELAFWRAAERSGEAKDYQAYLERYPNGVFAEFARKRLGLTAEAEIPKEPEIDPRILAERELKLSRARKRQIQTYLLALGHDPNGIDGLFGRGTRTALQAWQRANDLYNEGWLTADQVALLREQGTAAIERKRIADERERLRREAQDNTIWRATGARGKADGYRAYLEQFPDGLHADEARAALDTLAKKDQDRKAKQERRVFARAEKRATAEAYRDYLARFPQGIYRDDALAALDKIENAERRAAEIKRLNAIEENLALSPNDRVSVERRLRILGFEVGNPDGVFDERTRSAVKGYQSSRELPDTGYLDQPTVVALVRDTNSPQQGQVQIDGAQVIRGLLDALTK